MSGVKVFGRWSTEGVEVKDPSIAPYISLEPMYVPHTHGRHAKHRFYKGKVFIVERLINKCMRSGQGARKLGGKFIRGRNGCGKKLKMMKYVEEAFEIIEKKTKKNPIQVLVDAVTNAGPLEDTTRVRYGGITLPVAADVSPMRRVDEALKNIVLGAFYRSFNSKTSFPQALAEEIILAANNDPKSYAISRKEDVERIAEASR